MLWYTAFVYCFGKTAHKKGSKFSILLIHLMTLVSRSPKWSFQPLYYNSRVTCSPCWSVLVTYHIGEKKIFHEICRKHVLLYEWKIKKCAAQNILWSHTVYSSCEMTLKALKIKQNTVFYLIFSAESSVIFQDIIILSFWLSLFQKQLRRCKCLTFFYSMCLPISKTQQPVKGCNRVTARQYAECVIFDQVSIV